MYYKAEAVNISEQDFYFPENIKELSLFFTMEDVCFNPNGKTTIHA